MSKKPLKNTKSQLIWNNSPCSHNFGKTTAFFQTQTRFSYGSIYDYSRQSSIKNSSLDLNKKDPGLLLREFRREIQDVSLKMKKKNYETKINLKNINKKKKMEMKIVKHVGTQFNSPSFYEVPPKCALRYDRFGNRSHEIGQYNIKQMQQKASGRKSNFSFSRRMDLSRPLNFVPGPGAYQIQPSPYTSIANQFNNIETKQTLPLGQSQVQINKQVSMKKKLSSLTLSSKISTNLFMQQSNPNIHSSIKYSDKQNIPRLNNLVSKNDSSRTYDSQFEVRKSQINDHQ